MIRRCESSFGPPRGFTAVATHDERLIEYAIAFVGANGIGRERFEFQMLYGVRPQLQFARPAWLRVRVATPMAPTTRT
jgi:proline dehydrogenase